MKRSLEQLLDQCISQLNSGVDLETVLASCPEEAAELRPLLRAVAIIREVPHPIASPEARVRGKRELLRAVAVKRRASRVRSEVRPEQSRTVQGPLVSWVFGRASALLRPLLQPRVPMRRLAVTIATLLVVITMTGFGVTRAAANSLPDSPLYPVKLATEQIRLTLTTSSTAKAQVQLDRAEERLKEVRALIEAGRGADETALKAMQDQSRTAWEAIAQTPEGARESLLTDYSSWAQESQAVLKAVQTRLPPQEQDTLEETIKALSHDAALAEKVLRPAATPSPATETPLPTATSTAARVATETPVVTPTTVPTRPPATATPVPPTSTPAIAAVPDLEQPDLRPTRPATATRTPTATPVDGVPTPIHPATVTATPSAVLPTATPTEPSDITVPRIESTPFPPLPTPTPEPPTATPTPEEPPQVEQPSVQATTVPLLPTPTPGP